MEAQQLTHKIAAMMPKKEKPKIHYLKLKAQTVDPDTQTRIVIGEQCNNCLKKGKPKACLTCGMVYYCGKECQKAHWGEHKKICKRLRETYVHTDPDRNREADGGVQIRSAKTLDRRSGLTKTLDMSLANLIAHSHSDRKHLNHCLRKMCSPIVYGFYTDPKFAIRSFPAGFRPDIRRPPLQLATNEGLVISLGCKVVHTECVLETSRIPKITDAVSTRLNSLYEAIMRKATYPELLNIIRGKENLAVTLLADNLDISHFFDTVNNLKISH